MPIAESDIKYYLSGGAGNTDPNASLGGARSTTEVVDNVDNNLFDDVTGDESSAGDVEYRCIYVRQEHATLTLQGAKLWIDQLTSSPDDEVDIGLDPAGKNGTATTIADENTAPSGVTFSRPTTKAAGLSLGDLAPNDFYPFWIRRTVNAGAAAKNANSYKVRTEGDTAE